MSHQPAPLVFMDTETTGLERDADIWEFAAIRREPDGTETTLHLFIDHDWEKCSRLPDPFREDHLARFPSHHGATSRISAANRIYTFLTGEGTLPHVVGAVPNFDTERIGLLLRNELGQRINDPWHYHLIDVENLAAGALAAMPTRLMLGGAVEHHPITGDPRTLTILPEVELVAMRPPWDSDEISRLLGVEPDANGPRHAALADARWAMAIYDRVMGGVTPARS